MDTVNAKTVVTLVCLGALVIAVSIPLLLGKITMNHVYGFRIRKAFESGENWYAINAYGAKALIGWAFIVMAIGIGCLYIEPQHVLMVAKGAFISVLVPVALTLWYAKTL
jgi:hypothetical protein